MLRIRLRRVGKKKRPAYRLVVADSRSPRDGAFVDVIGLYDPLTEPTTLTIDADKVRLWLGRGAQPSERVGRLLATQGLFEMPARPAKPAKATKAAKAAKPAEAAAAEEAPAEEPPAEEPPTDASAPAEA